MKKCVILGGTFNPPHNGHLRILSEARRAVGADHAFIIPTATPPHKADTGLMSAQQRLDICRLAAENIDAAALDIEIKRGGKSYTIDTLEELCKQYPEHELYLTMGSDMLATLPTWKRYSDILALAHIIGFAREGVSFEMLGEYAEKIRADGGKVTLLDIMPDGISSTTIRQRLENGESVADMLPENVQEYL